MQRINGNPALQPASTAGVTLQPAGADGTIAVESGPDLLKISVPVDGGPDLLKIVLPVPAIQVVTGMLIVSIAGVKYRIVVSAGGKVDAVAMLDGGA